MNCVNTFFHIAGLRVAMAYLIFTSFPLSFEIWCHFPALWRCKNSKSISPSLLAKGIWESDPLLLLVCPHSSTIIYVWFPSSIQTVPMFTGSLISHFVLNMPTVTQHITSWTGRKRTFETMIMMVTKMVIFFLSCWSVEKSIRWFSGPCFCKCLL